MCVLKYIICKPILTRKQIDHVYTSACVCIHTWGVCTYEHVCTHILSCKDTWIHGSLYIIPLPLSHTMHSLVQEVLHCLRNSSILTPSGPDRPTLSHSQAVSWCWCHTWYRWPLVCGGVYSSTSEMVSHAGSGRGASHPMGKCWFANRSISCGFTCTTSLSRRVCSENHWQVHRRHLFPLH